MTHSYGRIMLRLGMDSPVLEPVSAPDIPISGSEPHGVNYAKLARMHIRDGRPFLECALACGYSESIARKGLRYILSQSQPMSEAIRREYEAMQTDVTKLKPVAVSRLYREIAAPDSPNAMKAIELAGRFRETDWFVRNTEVQLGIYMGMVEHVPDVSEPDKFKE